jgi:hypothetical protein
MNKEILITLAKVGIVAGAVLLAASSSSHAEDKPAELKQRILTQAQSVGPDDYAFTRTSRTEQTSSGKTETHTNIEKYDPSKSGDARWTLVSMDGTTPSADALGKYKKETPTRRVPGYYRLAKYFGSNATTSTDSRGHTVFHFGSLPKETALVMNSDVSSNTSAEVTVSEAGGTAFAEQVHLTVKPMRLKLIMKLDHYESTARYRLGPEGKPQLVEQVADMAGSGMGQEGKAHTVITYSDYRPVK